MSVGNICPIYRLDFSNISAALSQYHWPYISNKYKQICPNTLAKFPQYLGNIFPTYRLQFSRHKSAKPWHPKINLSDATLSRWYIPNISASISKNRRNFFLKYHKFRRAVPRQTPRKSHRVGIHIDIYITTTPFHANACQFLRPPFFAWCGKKKRILKEYDAHQLL